VSEARPLGRQVFLSWYSPNLPPALVEGTIHEITRTNTKIVDLQSYLADARASDTLAHPSRAFFFVGCDLGFMSQRQSNIVQSFQQTIALKLADFEPS
jgi:hypothetical protein